MTHWRPTNELPDPVRRALKSAGYRRRRAGFILRDYPVPLRTGWDGDGSRSCFDTVDRRGNLGAVQGNRDSHFPFSDATTPEFQPTSIVSLLETGTSRGKTALAIFHVHPEHPWAYLCDPERAAHNPDNRPEPGKQYRLTGPQSIATGNTWKESEL